jgi:hypothetical protein
VSPLRTAEPAAARARLSTESEIHADPERAADLPQRLTGLEVAVVSAPEHRSRCRRGPSMFAADEIRRGEELRLSALELAG